MTSGTSNQLRGIWGASGSDIIAVGDSPTTIHYDGGTWSPMSFSSAALTPIRRVWRPTASDVYGVGGYFNGGGQANSYDGST